MGVGPFRPSERLGRDFFARSPLDVAPELLGKILVHRGDEGLVAVRLVEVEAYLGLGQDPASHAHRGTTPRNRQMFATPGHLYVYISYGLHHCLNVVCEPSGSAGAVLLRAAEPLAGEEILRSRRGRGGRELTNGPGKLCEALAVTGDHDGSSLVDGPVRLIPGSLPEGSRVLATPRIGISKAVEHHWRYVAVG